MKGENHRDHGKQTALEHALRDLEKAMGQFPAT